MRYGSSGAWHIAQSTSKGERRTIGVSGWRDRICYRIHPSEIIHKKTHIYDHAIHKPASAQGPIQGLYLAISRDEVGGADIRILGESVKPLGDETEVGGVVELVDD